MYIPIPLETYTNLIVHYFFNQHSVNGQIFPHSPFRAGSKAEHCMYFSQHAPPLPSCRLGVSRELAVTSPP